MGINPNPKKYSGCHENRKVGRFPRKYIYIASAAVLLLFSLGIIKLQSHFKQKELAAQAAEALRIKDEKIAAVERKLGKIAKFDYKIREADIKENKIYGRLAMQNGYGAWSNDDFKAEVKPNEDGTFILMALYINEYREDVYYFDIRPGKKEIYQKIDDLTLEALNKEIEKVDVSQLPFSENKDKYDKIRDLESDIHDIELKIEELKASRKFE